MKTLLRSCFIVEPSDSLELFAQNYHALEESGLGFEVPEDGVIWRHIADFFRAHGHVPSIQSLTTQFTATQQLDCVDRLERLAMNKPRVRGDFLTHLEDRANDRRNMLVVNLAKDMAQIATDKIEIKDARGNSTVLRGAIDAVRYVLDKSHDVVAPTLGGKLSGNPMHDGIDFMARYDRIKADPLAGIGQHCGVEQIDVALNGAKRHELWIHAGFTGSLKSTFALHWAYLQAVYLGFSSVYFSIEMPYVQVRNLLYTMHTAHEDFAETRNQLGIPTLGLDYEKIKTGKLEPHEELFLREYVVPSFNGKSTVAPINYPDGSQSRNPADYGSIHIEVPDPEKHDFTIVDLRSKAEMIYSKTPFATVFVDHAGLMSARQRYSSTTDKLNEVIRDLKKMAMSFNRGMGIAVVALFQISREGYRAAEKNGGRYNLTHLSYANECAVRATPVPTDVGVLPIEEIEPGTRVWSRSGWKRVLHRFDRDPRRVWRIETERGATLDVTGNHRVRVLEREDITWRRTDELRAGDWVLGTLGDYPWASEAPRLHGGNTSSEHLTEELAYLLGAWDGDGRYRPNKIAFTGNRKEVVVRNKINHAFTKVFGEDLLQYNFLSRPGTFDEESRANAPRTDWFEQLAGSRGQEAPDVIFRAPRALVIAYLRGLWDTDGWINRNNIVGLQMKSRRFLGQIQLLMTWLGYETNLKSTSGLSSQTGLVHEAWTLRLLSYESRLKFQREIGFSEPWKVERLASSVAQPPEHKSTDQTYPVPNLYLSLYEAHTPYRLITEGRLPKSHYNAMRKVRETGLVCRQVAQSMLAYLDAEGISDPRAEVLRHLLSLHVCRVRSVTETDREEPVFDLEVDGDHEYQTGPILSHNCERSADIVTSSWIDDDLRKMGQAIFQCLKSRDQKPFERCPVRIEFTCRRFLTDHTPIETLDQKLKDARGEDPGIKQSKHKAIDLSSD